MSPARSGPARREPMSWVQRVSQWHLPRGLSTVRWPRSETDAAVHVESPADAIRFQSILKDELPLPSSRVVSEAVVQLTVRLEDAGGLDSPSALDEQICGFLTLLIKKFVSCKSMRQIITWIVLSRAVLPLHLRRPNSAHPLGHHAPYDRLKPIEFLLLRDQKIVPPLQVPDHRFPFLSLDHLRIFPAPVHLRNRSQPSNFVRRRPKKHISF